MLILYTKPRHNQYRDKNCLLQKKHAKRDSDSAPRAVQMFQCCGCDRLFATQQAVRAHITVKTKTNKKALLVSGNFKGLGQQSPGPGVRAPVPATAAAAPGAAGRGAGAGGRRVEDSERYFHKGLHNLSGPGPGFRVILLDLAAGAAPAAAAAAAGPGGPGAGGRGSLLAGGAASIPRTDDSGAELRNQDPSLTPS